MNKFILKWTLIGLTLRLILMPFTVHSDLAATDFGAYLISQKGKIIDFYDYKTNSVVFNYPPLAYLLPGAFMWALSPLYDFSSNLEFTSGSENAFRTSAMYKNLFLLKFPYLIFDFLLAYFLFLLFKENGERVFRLWMINPFTLYATFAMGQLDVMPTLCVISAILLFREKRSILVPVLLGLGGAFKLFPLLFLPVFALLADKNFWKFARTLVIGGMTYLAAIGPYLLFSSGYRQVALLAQQSDKMLFAKIPVSGAEYISVFFLGYFIILYIAVKAKQTVDNFWRFGLATMLLFFSVTHYHPQWLIWLSPFLIWDIVFYKNRHIPYIAIIVTCHTVLTFFFEPSLHVGLFYPVWPSLFKLGLLMNFFPADRVFLLKSLLRTLLAATSIMLVLETMKSKDEAKTTGR